MLQDVALQDDFHLTPANKLHLIPQVIRERILKKITHPICGFEHKRNPDGSYFSKEQQLQATHMQVLLIITSHFEKGASENELLRIIDYFSL